MKILRIQAVMDMTGLARSSIYALIATKNFPPPIKLGSRSVGWLEAELLKWIDERQQQRG